MNTIRFASKEAFIQALEDALTDEEREAQQEQAHALLDQLTGVRRG